MSKKYILIQNDGEIESNSFELIGASTKRGEKGKIGFFGSGLKYSIAYMMRKGIDFKIFSGLNELKFTTMGESLKDKQFERICINSKPTSYTTTMGPTWTEDWFVLREIYCNALDEGSCQLIKETENVNPSEGKTRIYIEQTDSLRMVSDNWGEYFADERSPLFSSSSVYTSALGNTDGGPRQSIEVYKKTKGVLYRRGIRVSVDKEYMYDYGAQFIDINEDRTAKYPTYIKYGICAMVASMVNDDYVKEVLRTGLNERPAEEWRALLSNYVEDKFSPKWVQFGKDYLLVLKDKSGKFAAQIQSTNKEVFFLPTSFAREMKKEFPEVNILGMGKVMGEYSYSEIEPTAKMKFLLDKVLASLKEMKYEIHFTIKVVEFDKENVLGKADVQNKTILMSAHTFDMGQREIALTLMEETEHIISKADDETRQFQTHIFSQWLKTMEEANGLFL